MLEAIDGRIHEYKVTDLRVVHETDTRALLPTETATLTLITCYPFDAIVPGGPLRYVVQAQGITGHKPSLDKKT
jgi:sortase A